MPMGSTHINFKPPKPSSHRIWQHHTTKHHQTWLQSLCNKAAAETSHHHHTIHHINSQINLMHACCYNLQLDLIKSPFQNAVANITTTPETKHYNTSKLAFHDLTKGNNIPPPACSVLGLGMKFIRTPAFTTRDISTSLTHTSNKTSISKSSLPTKQ